MTERITASPFEDWLSAELQRAAVVADDPRPAAVVARQARAPHRRRVLGVSGIKRLGPVLGLAAALLLPTAVFLAAANQSTAPTVSPRPPSRALPWDALLVRKAGGSAVDVVGVTPDGAERIVRHHDFNAPEGQAPFPVGFLYEAAAASSDGWLAMYAHAWVDGGLTDAWMLLDLTDPGRPVQRVLSNTGYADYASGGDVSYPQWPDAAAWGPSGRFAALCPLEQPPCRDVVRPQLAAQIIDPSTSTALVIEGLARDSDEPLTWAADGSGLLTIADRIDAATLARIPTDPDNPYTLFWEPERDGLGIDPIDGGPRRMGVPMLAWRPGPRWVVEGGAWVDPDIGVGTSAEGARIDWVSQLPEGFAPGTSDWVSLAADGRTAWLLLTTGPSVAVAQATAPGVVTLRSGPVGATAQTGIAGIAPDDSVIAAYVTAPGARSGRFSGRVALIPTDGGVVRTYEGAFAGFVPAGVLP